MPVKTLIASRTISPSIWCLPYFSLSQAQT
jgi:hypothetical protein